MGIIEPLCQISRVMGEQTYSVNFPAYSGPKRPKLCLAQLKASYTFEEIRTEASGVGHILATPQELLAFYERCPALRVLKGGDRIYALGARGEKKSSCTGSDIVRANSRTYQVWAFLANDIDSAGTNHGWKLNFRADEESGAPQKGSYILLRK